MSKVTRREAGGVFPDYVVRLGKKPLHFDPAASDVNVFYDETNTQVFVVWSRGEGGVVVLGPNQGSQRFRLEDRGGDVICICFSSDHSLLALQRSTQSVDFVNFIGSQDPIVYCQTCKGKNTHIVNLWWVNEREILFVTNQGIEYYEVIPEKKQLKCLKTLSLGAIHWSIWSRPLNRLMVSTGVYAHIIHPFIIQGGVITKLHKIEVDMPAATNERRTSLFQRDMVLVELYGSPYCIVILPQELRGVQSAEIVLYRLFKDKPAKKASVLKLNMVGRFKVNLVDNLLLVHHQGSKSTMLFDIKIPAVSHDGVSIHQPVIQPMSISPVDYQHPFQANFLKSQSSVGYELYSQNWVSFHPNIIIDAKMGCLWLIELNLEAFSRHLTDKVRLIEFLSYRKGAKPLILSTLKTMVDPQAPETLSVISSVWKKLNRILKVKTTEEENRPSSTSSPAVPSAVSGAPSNIHAVNVISQHDVYSHVFEPVFGERSSPSHKFPMSVMIEYISSLQQEDLQVHYFLYEILINTLVHYNAFYQLHQYLQYHVIVDSKPMACLLLSLESEYPPAYQIALDMLKRLDSAEEQIIEVLLSKFQVISALRYVKSVGLTDVVPARKYLEVAAQANDDNLFYSVFMFFKERNMRMKKSPNFSPSEHCDEFVERFISKFGKITVA